VAGLDLTGRTALLTGASRGIGLAIAQELAGAGANVVLTSRSQEAADAAANQVTGSAVGYGAHAADADAAASCIAFTVERFGGLDILINNAGTNPAYGRLVEQDHARFAKVFDVNVWAPIMWTSLAVDAWLGDHGGNVVNTASVVGLSVGANIGVYSASKAALIQITRQLAIELGPRIRVNAVAPGVVRTHLATELWKDHEDELKASTALRRIGEPADVASAVLFLASDASSWITGETLVIDGGALIGDAAAHSDSPVADDQ
jgi:NAD(P)-dependent dehydrogenase (short-subunit alcohol dehydrogenase family)